MSPATARYDFGASGLLRQRIRLLVTSRPVAWLSAWLLPGIDSRLYRLTRGRVTLSAWITGLPIVELVTTGASNPAWYHNLRAHPRASVIAGEASGEYDATELSGNERERGFQLAVSLNPGWRRFKERAGSRSIPVLRLTRVAASGH
jgi:deazaflavin-dependent oxidoreductase (nitroreductase family)